MAYYGWDNQREKGLVVYETYINKITIFIIWLLKNDYAVHLVIGETTDQQAVDDILSRIAQIAKSYLKDIVSNPVTSFNGLLKEMSTTDVVVATRYHNIVCALMLEKPVISLGYAKKNEVLLKGVKLDKYCQHIERIDIETLKLNFYEVVQHREILSKRIQKRNKRFRKILEDQFLKMFSSMQ
jgi:polysaccharide pyruvyl transferase WcaK-like protein